MKRKHLSRVASRITAVVSGCVIGVLSCSRLPEPVAASANVTEADYTTAEIFLCALNDIRVQHGLEELKLTPILMDASDVRAAELSVCWGHTRPDGRDGNTYADDFGIPWSLIGENIGGGSPEPLWVVDSWMDSADHRATMLGESYTHMGICCHYNPDTTFKYYWVMCIIGLYTGTEPAVFEGEYIPERELGDPNGTKTIDAMDAAAILQYTADIAAGVEHRVVDDFKTAADVNADGNINSVDAHVILSYAASAGSGSGKTLQEFCW